MGTQRLDFGCFAVPPCSVWTSLLYAFRTTLSRMDNQATLTGRFPGSSVRALSNHDRIACSVLRLRRDSDLRTAPGAWLLITAAGRNVALAWLRGARMGRCRCPAALNRP